MGLSVPRAEEFTMDLLQREMGIWGIGKVGRKASQVEDTQRGHKSNILRYVEL